MKLIEKDQKHLGDIAAEWDKIAPIRLKQIEGGQDLSFRNILLPTILTLSADIEAEKVLDVGCGTGFITAELALRHRHVIGIDPSKESIKLAQRKFGHLPNIRFDNASAEEFTKKFERNYFPIIVANMTLMNALSLQAILQAVSEMLSSGGIFIFTITHPCFWPFYWRYADASWFDYKKELTIEAPFRISLDQEANIITTHIHRPLEQYIDSLLSCGLTIEYLLEPTPPIQIMQQYPEPWEYPRFLAARCKKFP
jgi:ubiquinone/menaquinone biosynthesis C-methylase UbiE